MKNSIIKTAFTIIVSTIAAFVLVACGAPAPAPSEPTPKKADYAGWEKVADYFYRYEDRKNNIVCYWHWVKDNIQCIKLDSGE